MGKKLAGTIQISRASGGIRDDMPVHITISDESSGCRVLEIYMSLEEYAKATFSSQGQCVIEHYPNGCFIGMKSENKTEIVPFDMFKDGRAEGAIDAALKPFEIDGWKARRSDMTNGHDRVKGGQKVVFFRYVNPETGEPIVR